ncbi:MAG: DNA translocase FtsK 4TM domain-containing protein [Sphingomonadales bacterium]
MALKKNSQANSSILPERFSAFLRRTWHRFLGAALAVFYVLIFLSLFSHWEYGPGLFSGSPAEPQNWLGYPGAFISDFLLVTLGLGAYILILPLLTWGWRVFSLKGVKNFWGRLATLPVFATLFSAAADVIPPSGTGPFESGYGGLLGGQISNFFASVYGFIPDIGIATWIPVFMLWVLFGSAPFVYALGLEKAEYAGLFKGLKVGIYAVLGGIGSGLAGLIGLFKKDDHKLPRRKSKRRDPSFGELASHQADVKTPAKPKRGQRQTKESQTHLDFGDLKDFKLPTLDLLSTGPKDNPREKVDKAALEQNARLLESVLDDFSIQGEITKVWPGPVVTLYELEPAPGIKASRIVGLADDIARSMSAISARVAVIPGRNVIGIELPNSKRKTVYLRDVLSSEDFEKSRGALPLTLGKDISGGPVITDLAAMPHLLVAGTTGSGKSVGLNAMILSLLYRLSPAEVRFIMVDPKMLELSVYDGIPHLLTPVVTEPRKAIIALKWAVKEMEDRYRAMSKLGVRSLTAFNRQVGQAVKQGKTIKKRIQTGFNNETGEPVYEMQEFDLKPLPQIVIVIDEMADLMLVAGKDVEATVQRLAQMARAAGIHLVMATQRPSVDVITGTIKANFPTRIAFQVTSKIDSRTILGEQGAEQLLGAGDMLFMTGSGRITRVHGPFVSDQEVEKVVEVLKSGARPDYIHNVTEEPEGGFDSPFIPGGKSPGSSGNELLDKAIDIVQRDRKASTSYLQRRLQIGYNRAANLIEEMEAMGVVSEPNSKGRREVLTPKR